MIMPTVLPSLLLGAAVVGEDDGVAVGDADGDDGFVVVLYSSSSCFLART